MKISIDLDNVLFDLEPLYKMACVENHIRYIKPRHWNINECYNERTTERLLNLFAEDILYKMPLISSTTPYFVNKLLENKEHEVYFVTERRKKQPEKSYNQLVSAGINVKPEQVIDRNGKKSDILVELGVDLHFDDSPVVVQECLDKKVPIIMISNNKTLYNHFLRDKVEYYSNLRTALVKKGLINVTTR